MASPGDSSDSDCESSTVTAGAHKKPKKAARFLSTWKLPPGIIASKKGPKFAFCKYCSADFGIGHGGFNDITRHVKTKSHENKGRVVAGNRSLLSSAGATNDSLSTKVLTAEIAFTNFIAQHNLPFLANYISRGPQILFRTA